eukprot:6191268-Pleurochrysis_carterae.AAC.1
MNLRLLLIAAFKGRGSISRLRGAFPFSLLKFEAGSSGSVLGCSRPRVLAACTHHAHACNRIYNDTINHLDTLFYLFVHYYPIRLYLYYGCMSL